MVRPSPVTMTGGAGVAEIPFAGSTLLSGLPRAEQPPAALALPGDWAGLFRNSLSEESMRWKPNEPCRRRKC
jgi:hypothetical protein